MQNLTASHTASAIFPPESSPVLLDGSSIFYHGLDLELLHNVFLLLSLTKVSNTHQLFLLLLHLHPHSFQLCVQTLRILKLPQRLNFVQKNFSLGQTEHIPHAEKP